MVWSASTPASPTAATTSTPSTCPASSAPRPPTGHGEPPRSRPHPSTSVACPRRSPRRPRSGRSRPTEPEDAARPLTPASPPDRPGRLHHQLQLAPLVVLGDEVARRHRGETALGAQGQSVQGDVTIRLVDPTQEIVARFQPRLLGRDQP